jgi:hypothetical protein
VFSKKITKEPQEDSRPSRMSIVVKAHKKRELANCLLSLSHNSTSEWTTALLCGHGIIKDLRCDEAYGRQLDQIIDLVTSTMHLWNNPMLLPVVLLQTCSQRISTSTLMLQQDLLDSENKLGVVSGGGARPLMGLENWPKDVEVKETTRELHSTMTEVIFFAGACKWASQYSGFLLGLEDEICGQKPLEGGHSHSRELRDDTLHITSWLDGMQIRFDTYKERAQTQINVVSATIHLNPPGKRLLTSHTLLTSMSHPALQRHQPTRQRPQHRHRDLFKKR